MTQTITLFLQNPLTETFGWTLLHSLWQLALIAAMTALLLPLLRRAAPNTRYLLCLATLALCVALPIATFLQLFSAADLAPHPLSSSLVTSSPLPMTDGPLPISLPPNAQITKSSDYQITFASRLQPFLPYLVLAYFAGALLLSLRLVLGYCRLRQLRRTARTAPAHFQPRAASLVRRLAITRPIKILQSALVEVPTVIGHLRPIILFPLSTISGLTPDQLSALLAHELAHIRRHDYLLNLLQTLIETLLFYHPAVWWLSAKIRQEREHCCDDLALSLATDPLTYARALAQMESLRTPVRLSLAANSTTLLPRIRRILKMPAPDSRGRAITLLALLLPLAFLLTFLYIAACQRNPSPAPISQTSPTPAPATIQDSSTYKELPDIAPGLLIKNPDRPANLAVRARLEANIEELSAHKEGLEKVIALLRHKTKTNITVNWAALEAAGIERTTPVTVSLQKIPFRKVLDTLLSEVDGDAVHLAYTLDAGVIVISTRDDLDSRQPAVIRVFDIRDLLFQPDNSIHPPFGNVDHPATAPAKTTARAQIVKNLITTIQDTVAPDSWRDKGGKIGSIRELNGQLIVNQTVDNQLAVYQLLQQLREARVQIAVETHCLLIDDATFKKLNLPKQFDGTIINNMQLNDLLMAEQSSPNTAVLDLPRATLFSGQRGYIACTAQQNYIAACKARRDGKGKLVPDYTIQTFSGGLVLMFEGAMSRDRRYVVLKTHYALRHLEKMETLPAPGMPASQEFIIQKPIFTEHLSPQGMCSVPDGGTLVLNGPKLPNFPSEIKSQNGAHLTDTRPAGAPAADRHLIILIRPRLVIHEDYPTPAPPPTQGP